MKSAPHVLSLAVLALALALTSSCSKPAPDANRLQADLIGRNIDGWEITSVSSIASLEIRDTKNPPNLAEYHVAAAFKVPGYPTPVPAQFTMVYRLENGVWTIASFTEDGTFSRAMEAYAAEVNVKSAIANLDLPTAHQVLTRFSRTQRSHPSIATLRQLLSDALKRHLTYQPNEKLKPMQARGQALHLLQEGAMPPRDFINELVALLGVPDDESVVKAGNILATTDRERLRAEVRKLIANPDIGVRQKEVAAGVSWRHLKDPVAGQVLIDRLASLWLHPDPNIGNIDNIDRDLRQFPYEMARTVYAKSLTEKPPAELERHDSYRAANRLWAYVDAISRANDKTAAKDLAEILDRIATWGQSSSLDDLLKVIATMKLPETRPVVIKHFNRFLSRSSNGDPGYREALAALDNDPRWTAFQCWHSGGWPQWDALIMTIERMANRSGLDPAYDPFAGIADPAKAQELIRIASGKSPTDDFDRVRFSETPDIKVEATSPVSVVMETILGWNKKPLHTVILTLKPSTHAEYVWAVDRIELRPPPAN